MSTRSRIGIVFGTNKNELKVKSIYCHWDGYVEYNGKMLIDYYNNNARTEELINLGDISSLRKKISTSGEHSFDNPQEDVTIAYHRDRGEEKRINEEYLTNFLENIVESDIEFVYLRFRDEWLYATVDYDYIQEKYVLSAFRPLEYKVQELKKRGVIE